VACFLFDGTVYTSHTVETTRHEWRNGGEE
jgi:hypothetical protein